MIGKLREMQVALEIAQRDLGSFTEKGNDSAARRVRAVLMDVIKEAKSLRVQIQQQRK